MNMCHGGSAIGRELVTPASLSENAERLEERQARLDIGHASIIRA
jgi:hypothetical protein